MENSVPYPSCSCFNTRLREGGDTFDHYEHALFAVSTPASVKEAMCGSLASARALLF